MRDNSKAEPGWIKNEDLNDFQFKLCQNDWSLKMGDDKYLQPMDSKQEYCSAPAQAFLGDGVTKQCKTSFSTPALMGLHEVTKDETTGADKVDDGYDGFQLTWTSENDCLKDKKYKYTLNVLCDHEAYAEGHVHGEHDELASSFDWKTLS